MWESLGDTDVQIVLYIPLRVAEIEQLYQVNRMIGGIVNKTREDGREREREALRVCIQHACVCAFKTSPCVPATCPHEKNMWACCRYTRGHFERTHGDVLNAHTEVFSVPHHNKHHTTHNKNNTPNTHTHTPTHTHTNNTPTRTHQHAHTNTDHTTREM